VVSYEIREDFAESGAGTFVATSARAKTTGEGRDIYLGIDEREVDGSSSTCPSRGRPSRTAREALAPGGIVPFYLPSTIQVKQLCDRTPEVGGFAERTRSR